MDSLVPPQGDEHTAKSPGKTLGIADGGNAGGNIPSDLDELIELWPRLSHKVRNECLEVARCGLMKHR